eukprot:scaffold3079_cov174-Amphora_coffeaeformis.AAC.13
MSCQTAAIATSLNNEGISQLEANNFEAAAASFSRGLSVVKKALSSNDWENNSSGPFQTPQESSEETLACQFSKLHDDNSMLDFVDEDEHDILTTEAGFVFQEPIMVLPGSLESPSYAFFVKLSFIQLYNLALSHHLCALQRSNPEPFLRKALSLYELAYTIHVSEDVELTILQSMAIVNNLGHLHKQLDNIEKSQQCFENLLTTLMFVKDCGEQDCHQLLDGFLSNVMPLILCGSKPAPAA